MKIFLIYFYTKILQKLGNLAFAPYSDDVGMTRLIVGNLFFWSLGSPICSAVVVAAFSKILGSKPQGTLMGYMGTTSSIARIIFPLLPNILGGYSVVWLFNGLLCGIGAFSILYYHFPPSSFCTFFQYSPLF